MAFLQPLIILLLFVLVRAADLSITYGIARAYIRCIAYAVVAILALIALILQLGVK